MRSVLLRFDLNDRDTLITQLWELGTAGIIEETESVRAFFDDEAALQELIKSRQDLVLETREEHTADFGSFGLDNWEPIRVGKRFFVAPSWVTVPTPSDRVRLIVDGTGAFGSGRHESTQLMMEAMEEYLQPGDTVLDVGCGSGILSRAACVLGARYVFSCDIHWDAIVTAREYVQSPLFLGSVDAVRNGIADVTLANISARVIDDLAFDLKRVTKSGGLVLIAGFIQERPPVQFTCDNCFQRNEWQCWVCRPQSIKPGDNSGAVKTHSQHWW